MPQIEVLRFGDGLERFQKYVEDLQGGGLEHIAREAAWRFALHAGRLVRQAYREANYPISGLTLQRYQKPPIGTPSDSSAGSLKRSGRMAQSVIVRKMPGGVGYRVMIDPSETYSNGKLVADIAEAMERGYRFTYTVTQPMLAYLHVLRQLQGRPRSNTLKLGQTVLIHKEGRPVWEPTYKQLYKQRSKYQRIVNKLLKERADRAL